MPNWIAFSVVRLLEEYFGDLVEYDFTAGMEDDLDRIADGEADRVDWLTGFYFGNDTHRGLRTVIDNLGEIDAREINSIAIADDITLRIGKYGPYLEAPERRPARRRAASTCPQDLAPDELTAEKARELIDAPVVSDRVIGVNPENGKEVVAKDGRFGPYVTELEPEPEPVEPEYVLDTKTGELKEKKAEEGRGRQAAHRIALQVDGPRRRSTSTPRSRCSTCRASSGPTPSRAPRSPRRTAATART